MAVVKTEQRGSRLWSGQKVIKYKCDASGEFSVEMPPEAVRAGASSVVRAKSLDACISGFVKELNQALESQLTTRRVICIRCDEVRHHEGLSIGVRADVFDEETLKVGGQCKVTLKRPYLQEERKGISSCWRELNSDNVGPSWADSATRIPFTAEAQAQFERFVEAFQAMKEAIEQMMRTPESVARWALNPGVPALPFFSQQQQDNANPKTERP